MLGSGCRMHLEACLKPIERKTDAVWRIDQARWMKSREMQSLAMIRLGCIPLSNTLDTYPLDGVNGSQTPCFPTCGIRKPNETQNRPGQGDRHLHELETVAIVIEHSIVLVVFQAY